MAEIKVERRKGAAGWLWPLLGLALLALVGIVYALTRHGDGEREATAGAQATPATAEADCAAAQVHFATDSADIPAADQGQIARMAQCLKSDHAMKLTIVGTADPRGTPEHNAELGERRAMAVARALSASGVSPTQLKVVTYGDNYPLCGESDAACWAKNRQAALVPQQPSTGH